MANKTTAQWNLVVKMLNLTNWLNKQVPGNKLQIEDQNLTFLDRIDSSNKTNPTSKCKMLINDTSQWPLFVQWWHTHWNNLLLIKKWSLTLR